MQKNFNWLLKITISYHIPVHSDIQMEFFKSQLSDFEHNIFKNEAGIYLAGCHL